MHKVKSVIKKSHQEMDPKKKEGKENYGGDHDEGEDCSSTCRGCRTKYARGVTLLSQKKWDQAISHFEKLMLEEDKSNEDRCSMTMSYLATSFKGKQQYEKAIELEKKVFIYNRDKHGEGNKITTRAKYDLASLLKCLKDQRKNLQIRSTKAAVKCPFSKASVFEPISDILEAELGPEDWTLLKLSEAKAARFLGTGNHSNAAKELRGAELILEKGLGAEDPFTIVIKELMGDVLLDGEDYVEGAKVFREVYQWQDKWAKRDPYEMIKTLQKLGKCLVTELVFEEAMKVLQTRMELEKKHFEGSNKSNESTAAIKIMMSTCLYMTGDEERGIEEMNSVVSFLKGMKVRKDNTLLVEALQNQSNFGQQDALIRSSECPTPNELSFMAKVFLDSGSYTEAYNYYRMVWRMNRMKLGTGHPQTLASLGQIGLTLYKHEKYNAALERFQKLEILSKDALGEEHQSTLACRRNVAKSLNKIGEGEKAKEIITQVLAIEERVLGKDNPRTVATRDLLTTF